MRKARTDLPFRKGYKQNFTDKFFGIVAIPNLNAPPFSLIAAEKAEINEKLYEKELSLFGNKSDECKDRQ